MEHTVASTLVEVFKRARLACTSSRRTTRDCHGVVCLCVDTGEIPCLVVVIGLCWKLGFLHTLCRLKMYNLTFRLL